MHIERFSDASAFATLAAEWDDLLTRSQVNTPFQRRAFQRVWWQHFGSGELCILAVRGDDDRLAGIASLFVDAEGVLRWVGGEEIADYLDLIAAEADMPMVAETVFEWLAGPEAPTWQRAQLSNTPGWTDTIRHWQLLASGRGWQAECSQIDVCPVVPLPDTYEAWLEQIDSKQRREIKRKHRKAEAHGGVTWHVHTSSDDNLATVTDEFLRLMQSASADKAAFLTPEMRAAFRDIFAAMHADGSLELAFVRVEGEPVAAYASFNYARRSWLYNSGIDMQHPARALSPGWGLLAHLIGRAIELGHSHYDFLQGDEDYKYHFGGQNTAVLRLVIERQPAT